ncbi:DUF4911 domain-containing protein [Thermodesulfatator atlanticus]|uniref:DUF4911 domain-containing protein n=1 Tax=Thermodesulfatator atlanticus TaxID=501497 RepID=UPI0003B34C01|nr:DUF4911 domain-containing protein [Thermodesulfatator atlanticus]
MQPKTNEKTQEVSREETTIAIKVPKDKVYFVKFVIEAAGHLAAITVKPGGKIILKCDQAESKKLRTLLKNLPFEVKFL